MTTDAWRRLRKLTSARIALGRSGGSIPTQARLDFQLAHARARDAVHSQFDPAAFVNDLSIGKHPVLAVCSAVRDRGKYLRRPDLGRKLSAASRGAVEGFAASVGNPGYDLVIIVSDGLSTRAVETQAGQVIAEMLNWSRSGGWSVGPIVSAGFGRVALQDEIGEILKARVSLMLIGERPGLGSAESLGAYFTYAPHTGRSDAERNCVSNIHSGGLVPAAAAEKLYLLIAKSFAMRLSGVALKDDTTLSIGDNHPPVQIG